jgi:hypothetical protein
MASVVDAAAADAGFYSKKKPSAFPNVANDFLQTQASNDDPERAKILAAHKIDLNAIQERFAQVQRQFGSGETEQQSKWSRLRPAASGEADLAKVASSTINAQEIITRNKFGSAESAVCMLAFRLNLAHLISKKKTDLEDLVLKHTFLPDMSDMHSAPKSPNAKSSDPVVASSLAAVDRITGLYQELESARAREKEQAESRRTVVKTKLKPLGATTMVDSSEGNENAGLSQAELFLALKDLPTLRACLMHHHDMVGAVLLEHGVDDTFGLSIRSKATAAKESQRIDKLEEVSGH